MKRCRIGLLLCSISLTALSGCTGVKNAELLEELRGMRTSMDLMAKDVLRLKRRNLLKL